MLFVEVKVDAAVYLKILAYFIDPVAHLFFLMMVVTREESIGLFVLSIWVS